MNPDGSGLAQVTFNSTDDVQPYWSPDGNKIAFQAYRDGQPEVYVMNADGSGQTRLTYNADYDGEPAWSPDGGKLAFVSKRTAGSGDYFIYVMNADGTNQVQLSGWAYSEGPVWSPDGSKIAYDAAGWDYWQNLHVISADGSSLQIVFDEGGWADAWARSWSPDGRYLAFTRIYYVQCGSNLCWTNAFLDAWDSQTLGVVRLSATGFDWRPDWQSTDLAAPASTVNALPAESPGPFTVRWSGSDNLSGIGSYDVQVKDGSGGTWVDWQVGTTTTSASYPGIGGHTYYFRMRARDKSGNLEAYPAGHDAVTTVETLAPISAVMALPEFSKDSVTVKWGGGDLGGSGIATYDVQYRDVTVGSIWIGWQNTVVTTSSTFVGTVGHIYAFRARATDWAQNVEDWPTSGDAQTSFYAWAISGVVRDNTGAPVSEAAITTIPDAARVFTSNVDGTYATYVLTPTGAYTANWAKSEYGSLPFTAFLTQTDVTQSVFLPPLDNLIQDWGLEENTLDAWSHTGLFTSTVISEAKHTGNYGVELGQHLSPNASMDISPNADSAGNPQLAGDGLGILHAVWQGSESGQNDIWYSQKSVDGSWSSKIRQVLINYFIGNAP
jgi:dipeptidyl aminopeptidase/acylaminoacyl peptidase